MPTLRACSDPKEWWPWRPGYTQAAHRGRSGRWGRGAQATCLPPRSTQARPWHGYSPSCVRTIPHTCRADTTRGRKVVGRGLDGHYSYFLQVIKLEGGKQNSTTQPSVLLVLFHLCVVTCHSSQVVRWPASPSHLGVMERFSSSRITMWWAEIKRFTLDAKCLKTLTKPATCQWQPCQPSPLQEPLTRVYPTFHAGNSLPTAMPF